MDLHRKVAGPPPDFAGRSPDHHRISPKGRRITTRLRRKVAGPPPDFAGKSPDLRTSAEIRRKETKATKSSPAILTLSSRGLKKIDAAILKVDLMH
ncbi:hypothetical protein WN943_001912 [Citrus x changshan-huyou]